MPSLNKLYTARAAGERLGGLSHHTIKRYWVVGKLRKIKVGGRAMTDEKSILEFLARCNPPDEARQ